MAPLYMPEVCKSMPQALDHTQLPADPQASRKLKPPATSFSDPSTLVVVTSGSAVDLEGARDVLLQAPHFLPAPEATHKAKSTPGSNALAACILCPPHEVLGVMHSAAALFNCGQHTMPPPQPPTHVLTPTTGR